MIVQHAATTNIGGSTNMVVFVKLFSDENWRNVKHMWSFDESTVEWFFQLMSLAIWKLVSEEKNKEARRKA